ncbi:MAG: hypothetical protein H7Y06_01160 [Opitutaceae bacterium]|nr:hypothetical protein [Opitutaceae bacterium]
MKAKTEELLMLLFFGADQLMRPTYRNLNGSFESWAYGNGYGHQLRRLAKQKILEAQDDALKPVYRLTENGRLLALGGRDPIEEWSRPWDGRWRLMLFDLPETHRKARLALRRSLKQNGFGWLQNSAWISPHPVADLTRVMKGTHALADTLLFLECTCPPGYSSNAEIVSATWSFAKINADYRIYLQFLETCPCTKRTSPAKITQEQLLAWWRREHALWRQACDGDPFLPQPLHPSGYLGPEAWKRRTRTLLLIAKTARTFAPKP